MANTVGIEESVPQVLTRFAITVLSSFSRFLQTELKENYFNLLMNRNTLIFSQHASE